MSQFEVRAHLKVRDGQLEGFKRQAAEMMRVTREKDTGTLGLTRAERPSAGGRVPRARRAWTALGGRGTGGAN